MKKQVEGLKNKNEMYGKDLLNLLIDGEFHPMKQSLEEGMTVEISKALLLEVEEAFYSFGIKTLVFVHKLWMQSPFFYHLVV